MIENPWDDIRAALAATRETDMAVRNNAKAMGDLLVGKLRHVSNDTAARMKRELADFNIHTGKWKKR
jgi:hypothetical protein